MSMCTQVDHFHISRCQTLYVTKRLLTRKETDKLNIDKAYILPSTDIPEP